MVFELRKPVFIGGVASVCKPIVRREHAGRRRQPPPAALRLPRAADRWAATCSRYPGRVRRGPSSSPVAGRGPGDRADGDAGGAVSVKDRFDLVLVPEAGPCPPAGAVASLRKLLAAPGAAGGRGRPTPIGRPRAGRRSDGLGYYELHDALTPHFPRVQMLGVTPFLGLGVVEFDGTIEGLRIDSRLVKEGAEPPATYVAIAGAEPVTGLGYALVQLPFAALRGSAWPPAARRRARPSARRCCARRSTSCAGGCVAPPRTAPRWTPRPRSCGGRWPRPTSRSWPDPADGGGDGGRHGAASPPGVPVPERAVARRSIACGCSWPRRRPAPSPPSGDWRRSGARRARGRRRSRTRSSGCGWPTTSWGARGVRRPVSRSAAQASAVDAQALAARDRAIAERDERIAVLEGEKQELRWRLAELEDSLRDAIARAVRADGGRVPAGPVPPRAPVAAAAGAADGERDGRRSARVRWSSSTGGTGARRRAHRAQGVGRRAVGAGERARGRRAGGRGAGPERGRRGVDAAQDRQGSGRGGPQPPVAAGRAGGEAAAARARAQERGRRRRGGARRTGPRPRGRARCALAARRQPRRSRDLDARAGSAARQHRGAETRGDGDRHATDRRNGARQRRRRQHHPPARRHRRGGRAAGERRSATTASGPAGSATSWRGSAAASTRCRPSEIAGFLEELGEDLAELEK